MKTKNNTIQITIDSFLNKNDFQSIVTTQLIEMNRLNDLFQNKKFFFVDNYETDCIIIKKLIARSVEHITNEYTQFNGYYFYLKNDFTFDDLFTKFKIKDIVSKIVNDYGNDGDLFNFNIVINIDNNLVVFNLNFLLNYFENNNIKIEIKKYNRKKIKTIKINYNVNELILYHMRSFYLKEKNNNIF